MRTEINRRILPTGGAKLGLRSVYKRENSSRWQCATFLNGKMRRTSTKEDSLSRAKEFAEDWYLEMRAKKTRGELLSERMEWMAPAPPAS